jgi:N-acetylhexosamine 1-kinase
VRITAAEAAAHFPIDALSTPAPSQGGHIHRSWVVSSRDRRYLLQRLNTEVFADLTVLHDNTARITDHLQRKGLEAPRLVPTRSGSGWWQADDGSAWRLFEFLEQRRPAAADDAGAVGGAFGGFVAALADLPGAPLRPTIPGFHDLAARWRAFMAVEAAAERPGRLAESARERAAVAGYAQLAGALDRRARGVAHGDAKAANVLLDPTGARRPVVVDLDTAGPAPLVIDAGDLIRSCTVRAAEDETDLDRVVLEEDLLLTVIGGWLAGLAGILPSQEVAHIIPAGQAICWEQAVRFLADHLDGDRYYPAARPGHNLDRARTQLRLLDQLTTGQDRLQGLLQDRLPATVARLRPGGR